MFPASGPPAGFLLVLGAVRGRYETVIKLGGGSQSVPQDGSGHPSSISL